MDDEMKESRTTLKDALDSLGLLPEARRIRRLLTDSRAGRYIRTRPFRQRFRQFKQQYGGVLRHNLNGAGDAEKVALIASVGFPEVELELGLVKALELAGYAPAILILDTKLGWLLRKYYRLAAVRNIHLWNEFADPLDFPAAERVINRFQSIDEYIAFEYEGARVGRFAFSTALRLHRVSSLDFQSPQDRQILTEFLAAAMSYTRAAHRIIEKYRPGLVLSIDIGYTPRGELFDLCLGKGIDVIAYDMAHKNSTLALKRYNLQNQHHAPGSLSEESWTLVRAGEFTDAQRQELQGELISNYTSGEWYSICGTQFNKRVITAQEIRGQLGLDPTKKNAFIFPHIVWDASLFYGECLFRDYEEWLIETIRAACANDQVNWVIKIHPANVGKSLREGFQGEPAEVTALRKSIGKLPPHIFMIPAESEVSTLSLFELMDYCVTVRGTIGIEAATFGIPVLTAGTGRYDRKGFTVDSESREEYLDKLAGIQDISRLSPEQQELAERFAWGYFLLRPFPMKSVTLKYDKSGKKLATIGQVHIKTKEEWRNASDLKEFARWAADSSREDFLMPIL